MERTLAMPAPGLESRACVERVAERHHRRIFRILFAFIIILQAAALASTTASAPATSPPLLYSPPPVVPGAPWRTLNDSLLPYPVFYPAIAVMNNSILLLGGCVTTACDIPVGESEADGAASRTATAANSPYHEHIIALNVEKSIITALPRLTLPEGLGFAGRYAAVTLTDSVYVARSCTMSTHSADDISSMTAKELQAMQAAYAPVVAFYPEGPVTSSPRAGDSDLPAAVNLTYFVVPTDRVRVNASCTALATENKLLIIGGFLLSEQRATASVDSFDVVTRKYEADLAFLSRPVLQPSVAASTGFAAVAGGWTYDSVTTANAAREAGAPQEAIRSRRRRRLTRASAARLEPLRPVAQYMFDLLFFDPDRLTCDTCAPPLRVRRAGGGICRSPVDASTLPHTVVEDILLSPSGCHVAVFGGQVVLTDHNLSRVAVVDVRAKSASGQTARVLSTTPPPPLLLPAVELVRTEKLRAPASAVKYAVRAVSHQLTTEHMPVEERPCVQASCLDSGHAASIFMSTSTSSSAPPREDSAASSSSAAATSSSLSPTPEYRYAWMQPTLIPLSYTHRPAAADAPDLTVMTDTILIFYALGGEDVWEEVGAEGGDDDADVRAGSLDRHRVVHRLRGGTSTRRGDAGDADAVVRREAARRWAQRNLPDVDYDGDRPELLALTMPTPVWPDSLTLKTNSEGIIHLTFPDVNYSRYCTWKKRWGGKEDDVACSIRLSSRRDCVGNTAGTLDSAYDGTPNVTILFSASGSTTPVYVCFSYVVQPTSWPRCRMQQSFSILNPMMPLRILDNSPTTPAPTPGPGPSPTRDPADKTTSSPLFMLAVSVAVVTLLVAVLLVARLQHVPDDGLLVMSLFERGGSAGSPQAGAVTRSISSSGTRRSGRDLGKRLLPGGLDSGDGSRRGLYDWPRDGQGAAGSRDEEPPKVADSEDNDAFGLRPMETYADFLQVVEGAEEEREARMLATAADVLRLHQHRYRVLSRIGQGAHSLCFLALRKVPAPILAAQQQKVRGADAGVGRGVRLLGGGASSAARAPPFTRSTPFFPPVSSTSGPGLPTAATALVSAAAATVSSLWSARHDQNTAVVVKYTQCPDDATRAVITRMCERLRDLQVDTITEALGAKAVHGPHRNTVPSRHHHRWQRPSEMYSASAATDLRSPHTTSRRTRYIAHEGLSGTGSSDSSAAVAETPEADAGEATAQPASMRGSTAATITTAHPTGCKPLLPPSFLPEVARVHAEDAEEEDGSCAWLDAHEVNVVLSLFLMLPEDLFVSYEVSVLQQHRSSGRLAPRTVSRAMVEWNRRHVWPGWSPAQAEALHHPHLHECTPTLPTQQGFLAQFTPRVCWAACVNPLQPSTISPWSLCLVMPYERNGNLADFISRCRHVQLLPAGVTNGNESKSSNASSSQAAASSHLGPVHYCWTESLLCSLLFQVCTGLQLLHAQSPPILHGNIKPANVLLRAPASFSVARRRVVVAGALAPLAERRLDVSGDPDSATFAPREPDTQEASEGKIGWRNSSVESGTASAEQTSAARTSLWHAGGLVAAAAAVWHAGSPVLRSLPSLGSTPPLPRGSAAAPLSTAARSLSGLQERQRHPPLREHGQVRPQDLERRLLSTHTYLPISLTDGGMSWWLTVQLPLRLRGCFGRTTRSTLRQTPAGLCWLRRSEVPLQASPPMKSSAVPSDNCIAALAYFLFTFIEVPTHIAPELLWGQLCTMSQPGHGEREGGSVGAPAARGWSPTQPPSSLYPTRSRREQYARTLRRDDRRYRDGDSVVSRRCGDVTREPAQSPTAGSAKHVNAAPSDELSVGTAEDKQGSATLSPESRQEGPYADEDMDDRDVDLDVDEDGIFTGEEVSALTSAMWKAEGLTRAPHRRRYDRRAPPQQRAVASAGAAFSTVGAPSASAATPGGGPAPEEATQLLVDTNGAVGDGRGRGGGARGLPSSVSDVSLPANPTTSMRRVSPILSLQPTATALHPGLLTGSPVLASPCSTLHHHHHDMGRQPCGSGSGGRRMTGGGASVGGGGSRGSSGVYELLIQRVLAMDTASDVWSLGLLLYEMLADSVDGQHQQQQSATFTATTMSRPPHSTADYVSRSHAHRDGAHVLRSAMPTCSGASRLAQRAFAALLGDLYDLAVAGVPSADHGSHRWSCGGNGGAQSVGGDEDEEADAEHFDKAADERLRWPRSCALEDEVMQVVCNAGYTRRFASTLARMLSPVSARRPSAGDIVNDLRVVVAVTTATAALRSMRTGGSSFADEEDEYRGAEHTLHERTDHRGSAGDDIASAVVLSERTARMALRRAPPPPHSPRQSRAGTATMGVCSHSPAAPPLSSAYAHGASSAPSAGPRARNVGVRAGSARTTMHVAGAPESSVGGYLLVNEGPLVVRDETRTLTNSRVDAFHVLLVVFCLLLVVTVVLLAAALRLLRRVAAAVAAAEGSVVQSTLSAGLDAEGDTLHMSIGVDDEEDAAVPTGFRDSCTQLEEDARLQQPLLYRIHGRDSIARRHRCDSCRRQQQPSRRTTSRGFHARRAPLGISSAAPTSDDASDGEIATPRSGSQSHWAGCSAVPTPGRRAAAHGPPVPERDIRRPAGADASVADVHEWYTTHAGPKSTWQNSGSPSPSGAARKSRAGAVATAPPSPAPAAANHGGIRLGVDVQVPVFTATTEQDVVVYNTTHDSRYRILQRIGTGAFSSVYLVQQKTSGRILALKYTLCQDDRQRQAALRECEVIHCLQGHPQVIQIVDMFMSYQFDCARESPTTAGYPAVLVPPLRRREQAAVDQSSQPLAGVQPRAPAAIASVVSSKTVSGAGAPQILRDRPSEVATRTALFPLAQPPGAVRSHQRCSAATATPSLGNRCTSPVALVSTTTSWAAAQLKGLGSAGMEAAGSAGLEDLVVTAALRAHACGQTKGSSTECRTAVQDRDDDGDFSCMGGAAESECKLNTMGAVRRQYRSPYIATVCGYGSGNSEENGGGRRRGYHCMHSLADGVTCRAYAADADCVSDRQAGDCTLSHHHVAAIGVEKFKVSPEPILCATHTEQVLTSAPRWQEHRRQPHYPRPLQHGVQPASQGRGSFHLRFGITAKTSTTPVAASCPAALGGGVYAPVPLHVAASAGCQGYGRATLQSAPQPLAAPLTAASAAPVAATEASSLTRSTSHTGAPHMCWHTTNTAIGAVIDNDSDAATTANVSAGCCTTAGMSTTATAMDYCLPSTARNTTLSPSSGASRERSTREGDDGIDDFDSSSASKKIEAQAKRAARETAEMAQPLRRAPSRNSDRGDGQGGQPGHPAGKETWRTDLQANAVADETRSDGSDSARFSATTSSDTQEPTQPMYLILVPPSDRRPPGNGTAVAPESRCIRSNSIASKRVSGGSHGTLPQLQYRTHAPGEASPIAPLPSSANPPCCAGDAPAAVRPVTVSSSAAPSPVGAVSNTEGSRLLPATASSPLRGHTFAPVSSSASSPSGAATVQSIVHTSATPPQEQQLLLQPTSSLSAPQQRPMPSMAVSYSPARPGVSSADVSGDATGALSAGDPIRFKDFAPSPTTTTARAAAFWTPGTALQANGYGTATDAEDGRAHQQPHIFRGNPAQSLFVAAAGSENAIMGASGQGLDRQPSSFVDPYMERARGGEPVPPPRTSYAPGGGVRYNSLIVPYVAAPQTGTNGRRAQPGSNSSFFTVIASGTGTSAFEARKAVGGHEWRFQAAGAERGSPDTCVSASGAHALRLASPPPLLDASSATEAVVRDTYAPLRYSNAMQSGGVSLTTSSMACASAVSSLPPQQSGLSPSSPAPPPVASPALKNTPLVVPKAIRGAWAGQQGEHMDRKDGKPHINLPLHSANIALTPTQAPPSLPAGSLAGPASAAHLPRPGAAHCTAALSMKPLWASDGVAPTAAGLAAAPVTGVAAPPLRAGDDADREQQHHYGNARPGGAAPSPVRYTNAENPHLCNVYNANVGLVDAASAAAVSALANAPPTTDTRPPPNVCAGAGGFNGNASSTTTQMTASSDFPCNARDTGYLCLVMEYHPMGDLCRYVMRAKHQLEMRHHRQQQFPSHTLARSGAMSMATAESVASPATTTTLTSERSSFQQVQAAAGNAAEWVGVGAGVDGVVPTSPLSCRQSEVKQGGTAAVSSLLAAAAAATWTAKVARSHRDLHLALSAGVGGSGSSSGRHAAGGPEAQTTADAAADLTSDNPLTEAQLLSIAYQLASVLDHMHRQSPPIIHRDLKPENILIKGEVLDYLDLSLPEVSTNIRSMPSSFVSPADTATAGALSQHNEGGGSSGRGNGDGNDGVVGKPSAPTPSPTSMALEADTSAALWSLSSLPLPPIRITRAVVPIVLIDFGLSIQLDTRSRSYGSRGGGTRPYIAPESWQGGTCTASDVWSLGCVLYALATCRLTAKGVRIMSQEAKQDGFASRMLNDIIAKKYSLAFASFVVSLLVVDPAKRPTAAQAAQCFCVADGEVRFDLRSPFFSNVLDL